MTIVNKLDLEELFLKSGGHAPTSGEMCVMEAVAFVAGEKWSDHPQCASEVIGQFMRTWNDVLGDEDRQKLKPYIPKLVGTKSSKAVESKRAWLCIDWLIRHYTPTWLDLAGCTAEASALRAAAPILTVARVKSVGPAIDQSRTSAGAAGAAAGDAAWAAAAWAAAARAAAGDAAWAAAGAAAGAAARDAAGAAAWDAAWAAAWAAAGAAARAAARDAARAAAGAAAWAAAWAAARDAAWAALKPTVVSLQQSAFDLLDEMIALS